MNFDKLIDKVMNNPVKSAVAALALTIGGCAGLNQATYSEGSRVGVINKFSDKKGYVWKTYEGEMACEGFTSSGGQTGANIWEFSIPPSSERASELASKLDGYMSSGTKIKISYEQKWTPWSPKGSTRYYVRDVQPLTTKDN